METMIDDCMALPREGVGRDPMWMEYGGERVQQRFADLQTLAASGEELESGRDQDDTRESTGLQAQQTASGSSQRQDRSPRDFSDPPPLGGLPEWSMPGLSPAITTAGRRADGSGTASSPSASTRPQTRGAAVPNDRADEPCVQQSHKSGSQGAGVASAAMKKTSFKGQSFGQSNSDQPAQEPVSGGKESTAKGLRAHEQSLREFHSNELRGELLQESTAASGKGAKAEIFQATTKDAQLKSPKHVLRTPSDPAGMSSSESTATVSRTPMQFRAPMSPGCGAAGTQAKNPGEQILDSMHASLARGDRQVLVRLHPPELGSVLIRFQEDGQQVNATMEVARGDTRHEIEQALPQVLRGLQDAGVQVRKFEVVTPDLSERDSGRGQPQQDGWAQQHGSGQNHGHLSPSSQVRWLQAGLDHSPGFIEGLADPSGIHLPEGRIDMLL